MADPRIFFDTTYTRVQRRTVGIVRTVRRLADTLPDAAAALGAEFHPVAFHRDGFRQGAPTPATREAAPGQPPLLRWATQSAKPWIERGLALPWTLVRPAWSLAAGAAFGAGVSSLPRVQWRPGDSLLLFDASWNYPVWPLAAQARAAGARIVTLVHDLMPIQAPQYCLPWVRSAFRSWLHSALGHSDLLLGNSESTRQALRDYAQARGLALPPTAVLRLGNDLPPSGGGTVRPRLAQWVGDQAFYLAIGSLEPKKNYALLLDAFEQLWEAGEAPRLVLAGRPCPEGAKTADRLRRLQVGGRPVLWLDDAEDAEIAFLLRQAQALVLTTLFEGFGLPLVEARAAGCPVIATDLPCLRELRDAGVHLFAPGSPAVLAQLLARHREGRLPLSREPLRGKSWSDCAGQCLALVQRTPPRS